MFRVQRLVLVAGLVAPLAAADVVISNINGPIGGGTNLGVKEAGFRMPGGASFRLTGVTVRADTPIVGRPPAVWSLWVGDPAPTTRVCDLIIPPGAVIGHVGWVTLTPDIDVNLLAGQVYWVQMDNASAGGGGTAFNWGGTGGTLPTGFATHVGYRFNGGASAVTNAYKLEGEFSGTVINFDREPGTDGYIGTGDDVPIVAPALFVDQPAQQTTQFQSQGVVFLPNPSANDVNEILDNNTFSTGGISSEPNLFTTSFAVGGALQARFLRPVYSVSADIGLAGVTERLEILNASGGVIASTTGLRQRVTLESAAPIAAMRVVANVGTSTVAIDDLELSFISPFDCVADLSSSSDPNDPGYGVPDGEVDAADFFFYLDRFVEGCP